MEPIVHLENFDADHSEVSPSAASRWLLCPGSILLKRVLKIPNTSSEAAAEGTAAHWLAEEVLTKYPRGERPEELATYEGEVIRVSNTNEAGKTHTYDFEVDKLMIEHVEDYIAICEELGFGAEYEKIEQKVDLTTYLDIDGKGAHGYVDYLAIVDKKLIVLDFKYGKSVAVVAEDNAQCMLYALGALEDLSLYFEIEEVVLAVHQPRNGGLTTATVTPEQLDLWAMAYVEPAIAEIKEGSDRMVCDPNKQCLFCPGKNDCKLLAHTILDGAFKKIPMDEEITPDNLELKDLKVLTEAEKVALFLMKGKITTWTEKLAEHMKELALDGNTPEGLKLVAGRGSRSWTDVAKAEKALGRQGYGVDVRREPAELKSPAKMEKIIGKKHRIIKNYVQSHPGKPTLVSVDDKREAIDLNAGLSNFQKLESE